MTGTKKLQDQPFDYQEIKASGVRISYRGKTVTTLKGKDAGKFLAKVASADKQEQQLFMAKTTGHFKHGNERIAKRRQGG